MSLFKWTRNKNWWGLLWGVVIAYYVLLAAVTIVFAVLSSGIQSDSETVVFACLYCIPLFVGALVAGLCWALYCFVGWWTNERL